MKKIIFDYDEEADVLYVSFGKAQKALCEEKGNVAIRRSEKTGEVVGVTILNFLKDAKQKPRKIEIAV